MALTLLSQSSMPMKFWWDACSTSVFLINKLPSKVLNFVSPIEKLFGKKVDYSLLKVFGCECFPFIRPYNLNKFSYHSEQCMFLGYSNFHKGYKCISIKNGKVYVTPYVVFNEEWFSYSVPSSHAHTSHLHTNVSPSSFAPLSPIMQVPYRSTHVSS